MCVCVKSDTGQYSHFTSYTVLVELTNAHHSDLNSELALDPLFASSGSAASMSNRFIFNHLNESQPRLSRPGPGRFNKSNSKPQSHLFFLCCSNSTFVKKVSWHLTQWYLHGKTGSKHSHLCHFAMFFLLGFFTESGSVLYFASSNSLAFVASPLLCEKTVSPLTEFSPVC